MKWNPPWKIICMLTFLHHQPPPSLFRMRQSISHNIWLLHNIYLYWWAEGVTLEGHYCVIWNVKNRQIFTTSSNVSWSPAEVPPRRILWTGLWKSLSSSCGKMQGVLLAVVELNTKNSNCKRYTHIWKQDRKEGTSSVGAPLAAGCFHKALGDWAAVTQLSVRLKDN